LNKIKLWWLENF